MTKNSKVVSLETCSKNMAKVDYKNLPEEDQYTYINPSVYSKKAWKNYTIQAKACLEAAGIEFE